MHRWCLAILMVLFSLLIMGVTGCGSGRSGSGDEYLLRDVEMKFHGGRSATDDEWGFYNAAGQKIYWSQQSGIFGSFDFSSLEIKRVQEEYNRWVSQYAKRQTKGVEIGPNYSNVSHHYIGWHIGLGYYVRRENGSWVSPYTFKLPDRIRSSGALDYNTLMIPFYKSGVRIVELWQNFIKDCESIAWVQTHDPHICDRISLRTLASWATSDENRDTTLTDHDNELFRDPLLLYRATEIGQALSASLMLEERMFEETKRYPSVMKAFANEKRSKTFIPDILALNVEVAMHTTAAERGERAYRASLLKRSKVSIKD